MASDALSAAGRDVQCAACSQLWHATPSFPAQSDKAADPEPNDDEMMFRADPDTLFTQADEAMLDNAFVRADGGFKSTASPERAEDETPGASLPDKEMSRVEARARNEKLARRRRGMIAALPMARIRRITRAAVALALAGIIGAALGWRTEIVRAVPQLDGLYRIAGLGTNVVGLNFTDVKTLGTTRDGNSVLIVTAKISNITNHVAYVPSVLVSLVSGSGQVLYEWTVTPSTRSLLPGDLLDLDAQLTGPPEGVETVRLSFVEGQNRAAQQG